MKVRITELCQLHKHGLCEPGKVIDYEGPLKRYMEPLEEIVKEQPDQPLEEPVKRRVRRKRDE
jgi:hypothetical protein